MNYRIVPLSAELSANVRQTRTDPVFGYEYDVMRSVAGPEGYGPCRECLQKFSEGDARLLFLHNPFSSAIGDYAGPVFIHEDNCVPRPPSSSFPDGLRDLPMLIRGYDREGHLVEQTPVANRSVEQILQQMFLNESVDEIHIRNTEARCFIAKAVRGD